MSIDLSKYSAKKYKKFFLIIFAALFTLVATVGIVAAYYSDYHTGGQASQTGTLRINSQQRYFLNGTEKVGDIGPLTPGDVIVVELTVQNQGNISAWVRESISLQDTDSLLLPYISIYKGAFLQTDFVELVDLSEHELTLSELAVSSTPKVMNGSGQDAQVESGGSFDYLGTSYYTTSYTIYVDFAAPNATQGKDINLSVSVQALQFRNNNLSVPTELQWATVQAAV